MALAKINLTTYTKKKKMSLNNKSILITGGTGSFGKMFTKLILKRYPSVKRLVILSRDEQKHFQMAQEFSENEYPQIRYFIGDVRDEKRLESAFEDIDIIIHAAAMKHVHLAEYNPMECVKTNIYGAENVINAAFKAGVKNVVALSTDKAAAPINLYGATKLASDKLFIAANNIKGRRDIKFSVVRYGNVMGSNGSVMPFFLNRKKSSAGYLPITDDKMTRFNISLEDGCEMVFYAIEKAWGGEIFIPKLPSYKIVDVATAIAPKMEQRIVGIRPGEKLHEEMITSSDSYNTVDIGRYYAILPQKSAFSRYSKEDYIKAFKGKDVPEGFSYDSGTNTEWLNVDSLRKLVRIHVDSEFKI
jgi:UDP-N-acetylglucosamine 4,6-dehydratase (inverting)